VLANPAMEWNAPYLNKRQNISRLSKKIGSLRLLSHPTKTKEIQ